jgi:hypothetical protein
METRGDNMAKRGKSKASGKGITSPKIDLAKIKREVAALEKRRLPDVTEAGRAVREQLLAKRRGLAKKIEPMLVKGLDLKKAAPLLAKYHRERAQLLKKKDPAVARAFTAAGQRRRSGIASSRKALEALGTIRPLTPTIISLSPFLIKTIPTNALWASSMAPGNSWAQLYRLYDGGTTLPERAEVETILYFYYLWHNQSDDYAGVDVRCSPWFTGACQAVANTGIFSGGDANMYGTATLWPIWWNRPNPQALSPHTYPIPKAGQSRSFLTLETSGGGFWALETGDSDYKNFDEGTDLHYNSFVIPPRTMAVFQVDFRFAHWGLNDGYVMIDFAQHPSYSIAIPSLDIALFTSASVDAGPFGTVGASLD